MQERQVDAALVQLALQIAAETTLVDEWPRRRGAIRGIDKRADGVSGGGARAVRSIGGEQQFQVSVHRGIPLVHGDRRDVAAVREVTDDQQVTVQMLPGELEAAARRRGPQPDRILEEPEALLGVAAVVEAVRTEVENVTTCGTAARTRRGVRRQGIPRREAVRQVVLVRQAAR